jgi:hypothetical protein
MPDPRSEGCEAEDVDCERCEGRHVFGVLYFVEGEIEVRLRSRRVSF